MAELATDRCGIRRAVMLAVLVIPRQSSVKAQQRNELHCMHHEAGMTWMATLKTCGRVFVNA